MTNLTFQHVITKLPQFCRSVSIVRSRGIVCTSSSPGEGRRGAWDVRRSASRTARNPDFERHRQRYRDSSENRNASRKRYSDSNRRRPRTSDNHETHHDESDQRYAFDHDGESDDFRTDERRHSRRFDVQDDRPKRGYRREDEVELSAEQIAVRAALNAEDDDLVYGISPVLYALRAQRRKRFQNLFVQAKSTDSATSPGPAKKADNNIAYEEIRHHAKDLDIPIVTIPKGELNLLSKNRPHQGVVLQAGPLDFKTLTALPTVSAERSHINGKLSNQCYVVLDEVTDPQNAGAIMRSAYFLGATGVIVCMRNSCGLTPVVSKASAGSMELMEIQGVSSMPRFLRAASRDGWKVVGMARGNGAVQAKELVLDQPTLVVLGSEGSGLRTLVKQACDIIVEIGGRGQPDHVDSLNVSVAGAVALYQLLG